jgi:putative DNA primase/helicase
MNTETMEPPAAFAPTHRPTDSPTHFPAPGPTHRPTHSPTHSPTHALLDALVTALNTYVVLPEHAPETIALWTLHTYAFQLRDVSTYLGIESPEKRCGKTTLLTVLSELCNRAIVASNISSPAFFRVIEETRPTLLIDEADTFLQNNDELRGILNSGYSRKTAYVVRVINERRDDHREPRHLSVGGQPSSNSQSAIGNSKSPPPTHRPTDSPAHDPIVPSTFDSRLSTTLGHFSTWCPKAIAAIGHLPDTLADRCIVIRMQRKTNQEQTQRLRHLQTSDLRQQCEKFVATHANAIANAQPEIPNQLNDRAADIWEPLLVLADIAGGEWPQKARESAVALSASSQESNPIGALLMDILVLFAGNHADRIHTRTLIESLQRTGIRPWNETLKRPITDLWLAQQLRPYGIRPRSIRIGGILAKGYVQEEMVEAFRRYIPKTEIDRIHEELAVEGDDAEDTGEQAAGNVRGR